LRIPRLHHRDALLDELVEILIDEGKVELAGFDPGQGRAGR
jgi:hypothetical protein